MKPDSRLLEGFPNPHLSEVEINTLLYNCHMESSEARIMETLGDPQYRKRLGHYLEFLHQKLVEILPPSLQ